MFKPLCKLYSKISDIHHLLGLKLFTRSSSGIITVQCEYRYDVDYNLISYGYDFKEGKYYIQRAIHPNDKWKMEGSPAFLTMFVTGEGKIKNDYFPKGTNVIKVINEYYRRLA